MHLVLTLFRRISLILPLVCLALLPGRSIAQPDEPSYYGFGGGLNINQHSLERPVYRGSELCGVFTEGSGLRPEFHLLYETKPAGWPIWLSPRLIYNGPGGDLTA